MPDRVDCYIFGCVTATIVWAGVGYFLGDRSEKKESEQPKPASVTYTKNDMDWAKIRAKEEREEAYRDGVEKGKQLNEEKWMHTLTIEGFAEYRFSKLDGKPHWHRFNLLELSRILLEKKDK